MESSKAGFKISDLLSAFKNTLPDNYRVGFSSDINNCAKGLNLPTCLIIEI